MASNKSDVQNSELNDEIVISGISGLFPSSNNADEFMQNLYNKVDMVTSDNTRWNINDPNLPKHIGKVEGFHKFDAQFFKVSYKLAYTMEPMAGKLLEQAYGAIFDSGTSVASLKRKRVGVFIGSSFADTSSTTFFDINRCGNFVINGSSKAMFANRISYWLDATGPSYCLDYSCAGSSACLEMAYRRIKAGDCDAALVGGCNFCLYPNLVKNMRYAGLLCLDGKTKCFDKNADGYVRSDAISLLFLQKAKDAKRIYAEVCHVSGEYKIRPDAGFLPLRSSEDLQNFLEKFYAEAKVDPTEVHYVEANGAAIAKADLNEMDAIGKVFAKDKVIKIGSVKSNMGHSEPASGVTAITKLCLAYHKGMLPGNLHYSEPHDSVPAIRNKRIQVVTENEEFNRGLTAVNNFSFTGANYHVLLKGHYKKKDPKKYQCGIPQLVLASGRQEDCTNTIFEILKNQPLDLEQIALLRNVFKEDILGHTARGYAILDTNENNETVCLSQSVDYYPGIKRPVWFVYSGMGSQWVGMGSDLMRIPIFADAIHRCNKVLEPKGIDLVEVLTSSDKAVFDEIINGFVGIGAIQIALTDVLKAIGIVPDHIVGHSLGEMACAYQDGTLTAEELVLSTFYRGKVCHDTPIIRGAMAAVGIGYKSIMNQCPPDIDVACHNSSESSTISGPAESMKKFVGELTARGVFAKEVPCANIPYHSRYLAHAGSELLKGLRKIIKEPKPRSNKWLSTSVPQHQWNGPLAKYSSAEYHTNNLLSPVLFEETISLIPENAIVIEIAPHGLLQAILKRSHSTCTHIPLAKRGVTEGVKFLIDAIGKMYQAGLNPNIDALYPAIEYPVSTETPLLSQFVQWEHSEDWPIWALNNLETVTASTQNVIMSVYDDDYKYLEGHVRDGTNVLPEAAILVLVWETVAMYKNMQYKDLSVVFKNVHFLNDVVIKKDTPLKLSIQRNIGDKKFEVCQEDTLIATGVVSGVKFIKFYHEFSDEEREDEIILDADDVYKILASRGFSYDGLFKSIHSSNIECDKARVKWTGEWVTFLDSLIQMNILARGCEGVSVPKFIRKLSISMVEHEIARQNSDEDGHYKAYVNKLQGITRCAGVEIDTITFTDKPVFEKECDVLESRSFFPYYSMDKIDINTALSVILQIVAENTGTNEVKVTELGSSTKGIIDKIKKVADKMPINVEIDEKIESSVDLLSVIAKRNEAEDTRMFVIEKLLSDEQKLNVLKTISKESFLLAVEQSVPNIEQNWKKHFTTIASLSDGKQILILLKRAHLKQETAYIRMGSDNKFSWVPRVYGELKTTKRVVLISERQPYCGVLGFVQKLRNRGAKKVSAVIIDDFHAPGFNPEIDMYKYQIHKNLAVNILKEGQWGSYSFITSPKSINVRNATLTKTGPCFLDGLKWVEAPPPLPCNELVQISFAGLSIKDIERATSTVATEGTSFGMDFSGFDSSGDRVMGVISRGSLSSAIQADLDLLWPVPDYWSLEEAATVPLPYVHAYYCLCLKVKLFRGQTVLVLGGAGAFGQAVIALCLSMDCTVFTTVSTREKKSFLLRLFPELKESNIGYSGDDSFHNMVAYYTKNKCCDLVISYTTGSLREAAMKCVGMSGNFLDLSKYDICENKHIGMDYLFKDRSYRAVDLSNIFRTESKEDKKVLQRMVAEGIAKGIVRPLTRVVYASSEVSRGFKLLSTNRHKGRVLIQMRDPVTMSQGMPVAPRMSFSSKGVYIVVCDETDLGVDLVDRLVKRGVKKIVIHTKARPVSGYIQTKFALWMKQDVKIKLSSENLQYGEECMRMLKDIAKIGQVYGLFIVKDSTHVNKNNEDEGQEEFMQKFNKIALAVANLDVASRSLCGELRHFVVLARCSQYDSDEYAVSIAEGICRARSDIGYPALVLRYNVFHDPENKFIGSCDKLLPAPRSALFDAMEKSLKLKHKYVRTFSLKNNKHLNFAQKISEILGIKSIDEVDSDKIVDDFKLSKTNLEAIKSLIKEECNTDYHVERIQRMSFASLKNIGENDANVNKKNKSGLEVFYTHIENEEEHILTSFSAVPVATLLNNGIENYLDPNATYLTMIPGFEGRPKVFSSIAERLKVLAVAVPLGPDMAYDSIPQTAAEIRKIMQTRFVTKSKFYLLGYSFGVNVALELAALLEQEGHEGVVYCLDSSPDALRVQINVYLGNITRAQLQNIIIEHAYYLMTGQRCNDLKHEVKRTERWSDKIECCLKKLNSLAEYSIQYKKEIMESMYKKFLLAYEYKPEFKLRSQLVLIKGTPDTGSRLEEDYGLSDYSTKKVLVYNIESDHTAALRDCMVPSIINRLLDPTLLEEYKKKNLCDTYFIKT